MEIVIFILSILGLLFVVFPIYVFDKITKLTRDVEDLKRELAFRNEADRNRDASTPNSQAHVIPTSIPPMPRTMPVENSIPTPPPIIRLPEPQQVNAPAPASRANTIHDYVKTRHPKQMPVEEPQPIISFRPDFESMVGANWLAKLGVAAIAIAMAFFLQYAFASGLIGPGARVIGGLIVSALMFGTGYWMMRLPKYRTYGEALASGGIAVYFLSVYAAYNFYHFVGFTPAFAALAGGAIAASLLAAINKSEVVALICILGAFAAPALIREPATASHHPDMVRLYSYIVGLNIWVVGLMWTRKWLSVAIVAFASTWILFLGAADVTGTGWTTEIFAAMFLFCAVAASTLIVNRGETEELGEDKLYSALTLIGLGMILGGCTAFTIFSVFILKGYAFFGVPDLIIAASFVSLLLIGMSNILKVGPDRKRQIETMFVQISAVVFSMVIILSVASEKPIQSYQVPTAFAFSLILYLLFTAVTIGLSKKQESEVPSVWFAIANALVHTTMTFDIMDHTRYHGVPVAFLWLPVAGLLPMAMVLLTFKGKENRKDLCTTFALTPLVFAIIVSFGVMTFETKWQVPFITELFAAEFVVTSLFWLALNRFIKALPIRLDFVASLVTSAAFMGMMSRFSLSKSYSGFQLPAILAISMAAYHAVIAGFVLTAKRNEPILRKLYIGLAITFFTVAIPMQLKASYITLAWAVEAVVLLWTGLKGREITLRIYAYFMMAVAAFRALFIDIQEAPHVFHLLWNTRMLAGASVIISAYICAWLLWKYRDQLVAEEKAINVPTLIAANIFTLLYVSVDLWDYSGVQWAQSEIASARQLSLSIWWTIYALAAVLVGVWKRLKPVRLFAMGLLYLSVTKVFLFDLSGLKQPYRIVSFFVLGVILLLVSLLYTKFEERLGESSAEKLEENAVPSEIMKSNVV
ncbi:MAG: DUF2339 domain-containing protein [Chthonomonadales bacterium]